MVALNIIRIIVQIVATLLTIIGIAMIAAGILSSGWQIMIEPGVGEIHQHGLWMDYVYSNRMHIAGAPNAASDFGFGGLANYGYGSGLSSYESGGLMGNSYNSYYGYNLSPGGSWIMTYKFGSAVYGDQVHQAMPFQIYALVLLVLALVLSLIGLFLSYCASMKTGFGIAWAVLLLFAVILGSAGLIQFYISALLPEYRFAYTDRRLQQFVGYSYWYAVIGIIGIALGMIGAVACAVLLSLMARRGEKAERAIVVFRGRQAPVQPPLQVVYDYPTKNGHHSPQTRV